MNGRAFWILLPVALALAVAFARSGASADRRKLPGRFQMAALCRVAATLLLLAALPVSAQLPMNIQQTVCDFAESTDPNRPGSERCFIFKVENNSPGGDS